MSQLVSSWSNGVQSIPKNYIMPPDRRPGDFILVSKEIPVIDLQGNHSEIIDQIMKASQEYGVFQVINHGVPDKMMENMMALGEEFFNMKIEDKLSVYSETYRNGCTLFTSAYDFAKEELHFWKDALKHGCYPVEKHSPTWPEKPARYREVVGRYVVDVRKMGFKILDLICEGLGLNHGYFNGMGDDQTMAINHYPKCPEPSLAMGLAGHIDPTLINFIQQDQYGLQICKDGKWMGVEPIPNAFVVTLGLQLLVISNGKFKGGEHRVVTNSTVSRTSIATSLSPDLSLPIVIEPAKELVTSSGFQMFKSYQYKDFFEIISSGKGNALDLFRM